MKNIRPLAVFAVLLLGVAIVAVLILSSQPLTQGDDMLVAGWGAHRSHLWTGKRSVSPGRGDG